ncbi:MAG: zinc ribbon domain-containing protein [Nitrospira sp.]|nr:zinc ribbon domain-containing protein [Nitrospira sp.]
MQTCPSCRQSLPEIHRFCTQCGQRLAAAAPSLSTPPPSKPASQPAAQEQLNLNVLYGMVGALILAVLLPPWETPPTQSPEFLGFHSVLSPPAPEAIISRMLLTIELTTITIAGLYAAFFFRKR